MFKFWVSPVQPVKTYKTTGWSILFHIISLLPFESAIQTIFLSTRWRLLWNMALVQKHGTKEDVASAVSQFLTNFNEHDPRKNTRRFMFHFGKDSILTAIIAPNNKLHLHFSAIKQEFPRRFGLVLELNPQNPIHQPNPPAFFVKTLNLSSVNYLSNDIVSSIISSFRFLENLKIDPKGFFFVDMLFTFCACISFQYKLLSFLKINK